MQSLRWWVGIVAALIGVSLGQAATRQRSARAEAITQTAKIFDATAQYFMEENVERGVSAVPGGARDIGFARQHAASGQLRPNAWTPEGLLAEHELPLSVEASCQEPLCIRGEAIPTELQEPYRPGYIALVGLDSATKLAELSAEPLHLVIALDRSSSMAGEPLDIARAGLRAALQQLGNEDRVSLVTFADVVVVEHVSLRGTEVAALLRSLPSIQGRGSTDLESGLRHAFDIARDGGGRARVLLLTDEQPTTGRVDAESLMELSSEAAQDGIGLSVVGIGRGYGIDLAHAMAMTPHANVSYARNEDEATRLLGERFDSIVTEVATEAILRIDPAEGVCVRRVFGVPSPAIAYAGDCAAHVTISSLFASDAAQGILVAFSSSRGPSTEPIASLDLRYLDHRGDAEFSGGHVELLQKAAPGLARARSLVDMILTIESAGSPRGLRDRTAKDRLLALQQRLERTEDVALLREAAFVGQLLRTKRPLPTRSLTRPRPSPPPPVTRAARPSPRVNWALPFFHALVGFLSGFAAMTLLQYLARSMTVRMPTARTRWTLAAVLPLLVLASWLGHRGATRLTRVAAFMTEVEGFGEPRGVDEVGAERRKATIELAGALGLMGLALVVARLRRPRGTPS